MPHYWGFNAPFVGGPQKFLSRQEDLRLVQNDVLQLLFTLPGERVHRLDFGTRLRSSVFEPLDEVSMDELADDIRRALDTYEPRLLQTAVYLTPDRETQQLKVMVVGTLSFDPTIQFKLETQIRAFGGFED